MKRISLDRLVLTLVSVLFLSLSAKAVTITDYPYNPPFAKGSAAGWTTYKGGAGTWSNTVGEGYWQASVGSGLSNAWLYSPALDLKGGYKYTFSYTVAVGSSGYPKEINQSNLLSAAQSSATVVCPGILTQNSADNQTISTSFTYSCTADETVYFAINHLTNGSDKGWKTNFKDFSVTEEPDVKLPNPVTGLTAVPADDGSRSVTLSWTNPSTYNFGDDLTIAAIDILRDEVKVNALSDPTQLAPGADVSISDSFPKSGKYTYTVTVRDAEGLEASASVSTPYIGPLEPLELPYDDKFETADDREFWTIANYPEEDYKGKSWTFDSNKLKCDLGGSAVNDSWAFSRPLALEANKAYRLTINHRVDNKSNPFPLLITLGTTVAKDSHDFDIMRDTLYQLDVAYTDKNLIREFSISEGGAYHLGINSFGKLASSTYSNKMTVNSVKLEEIPINPLPAADLTVTDGAAHALEAILSWRMPEKSETGIELGNLSAAIYRDGEQVALSEGMAGSQMQWTDSPEKGLIRGFHKYFVKVLNGEAESVPTETVSTGFLGDYVELPFTSDFETETETALWTVIDNSTLGGKGFEFTGGHAVLDEGSGNKTRLNDWLVTPMFKLTEGKQYEVTVHAKSVTTSTYSGVNILPDFHIGTSNTPESMSEEKTTLTFSNATAGEVRKYIFTAGTGEGATVGIHVTSPTANAWGLDIFSLSVDRLCTRPAVITDAKALAASSGNSVVITATMPVKDDYSNDLAEDASLTLSISREGEESALALLTGLVPGQKVEWTDSEAANGFNRYVLVPAVAGDEENPGGAGASTTVSSDYVGDAQPLPFEADFTNESGLWSQIKEKGDYEYKFDVEGHEGHAYLLAGANEDASATYQNWLVTPPFSLKAGKAYRLHFTARSKPKSSGYAIDYAVYVGKMPDAAELKKGKKITATGTKVTESVLTPRDIDFFVEEDGKYFIGYYVDAGTDSSVSEIGEWTVTQQSIVPMAPTNVKGELDAERHLSVSFTAPSKNTMGGTITGNLTANLYRDGESDACVSASVEAGTAATITAPDADSRYHSYKLTVSIPDDGESSAVTVGTFFTGEALGLPYNADFAGAPYDWKISNSSMGDTKAVVLDNGISISSGDANSSNVRVYAYSPYFNLSTSKAYRLTASVSSTGTASTVKVCVNPESGTPMILASGVKLTADGNELSYDFRPDDDGLDNISFYFERGYYNSDVITLSSVSLAEIPSIPAVPASLSAIEDVEELDVLCTAVLPQTGSLGEKLPEDAILKARFYINGEVKGESDPAAPGEEVSVLLTVPANGIHSIGVSALLEDAESDVKEIRTGWIGSGLSVTEGNPYQPTLDAEGLEGYTVYCSGTSYTGWNLGTLGLQVDGKGGDYWIFTTPFHFKGRNQYRLEFDHVMQTGVSGSIEVFMGDRPSVEAMTKQIGDKNDVSSDNAHFEEVFNADGTISQDPEEDPEDGRERVAPEGTRTYIGIKASDLYHTSSWTNPRMVLDSLKLSLHRVVSEVEDLVAEDGVKITDGIMVFDTPADVRIFTSDGRLEISAFNVRTIDTSRLHQGIHIVSVSTPGRNLSFKFRK